MFRTKKGKELKEKKKENIRYIMVKKDKEVIAIKKDFSGYCSLLVSLCSIELNFFSTNIENLPLFSLTIISFKIYNINRCNSLLGY